MHKKYYYFQAILHFIMSDEPCFSIPVFSCEIVEMGWE